MEEIDEEERLQRQNALHQQLEHLEQCEQLEHTAQLKFREWLGRFQQQQEQRAPINRVMSLRLRSLIKCYFIFSIIIRYNLINI